MVLATRNLVGLQRNKNGKPKLKGCACNDGFIITVFMTSKPEKITKKGVIWRK